jgi:hypothetical protein
MRSFSVRDGYTGDISSLLWFSEICALFSRRTGRGRRRRSHLLLEAVEDFALLLEIVLHRALLGLVAQSRVLVVAVVIEAAAELRV